jgi:DNA invertase Pin-like site-specific DNA recombinase
MAKELPPVTTGHVLALGRKSTKPGEDNLSLETQEVRTTDWARNNGKTVEYQKDIVSGWAEGENTDRLHKISALVKTRRYEAVAVQRLDRWGRQIGEVAIVFNDMKKHGVLLVTTDQGVYNLREPMQEQMALQEILRAQMESTITSKRVSGTFAVRKESGGWLGGVAPFGLRPNTDGHGNYIRTANKTVTLAADPDEAPWVEKMALWLLNEGLNCSAIARRLNEAGVTGKRGKKWSHSTVRKLLTNPVLVGCAMETGEDGKPRVLLDGSGEVLRPHEPILSQEVFSAVQAALPARPKNRGTRGASSRPLFRPRCGHEGCDGLMLGSKDPKGQSGYACKVKVQDPARCSGNAITGHHLDTAVTRAILRLLANQTYLKAWQTLRDKANASKDAELAKLYDELAAAQADADFYEQEMLKARGEGKRRWSNLFNDAMETIDSITASLPRDGAAQSVETFAEFLEGHDTEDTWRNLPYARRCQLADALIAKVVVRPGKRGGVKGAFGAVRFDPTRITIFLATSPDEGITLEADDDELNVPTEPIPCPECGKMLKHVGALGAHRRFVHGVAGATSKTKVKTYPCGDCEKVLRTEASYKNHRAAAHGEGQRHQCPECERDFAMKAHLVSHLRGKHADTASKIACDDCGKLFTITGLRIHQEREHKAA